MMLLETCLFYVLVSNDKLRRVCVTQLGGWSSAQRIATPGRYIFWVTTTTTMLAMMGRLARAPQRMVQLTLFANGGTLMFGMAAALVDSSFVAWVCLLSMAILCCCYVTVALGQFLRGAHAAAGDDLTRQLLRVLGPIALLAWVAYPAFWLVCALGGVSMETEQAFWPMLDLTEKAIISLHMTAGDFSLAATAGEALLQTIDDARQAAVLANDAKRDVVRYLFHEIRVPLNSIVLAVEDLSSSTTPPASLSPSHAANAEKDRKEILGILSASAADMTHLLDSFLSLEKVESGRMELELEESPVLEKLQHTMQVFSAALAHRSLHVTLTVDPEVPSHVVLDPNRIRQCISNFLSNAIKFSPKGGTIAIRAEVITAALSEAPLSAAATAASIQQTADAASAAAGFIPSAAAVFRGGLVMFRRQAGKRSAAIAPSRLGSPTAEKALGLGAIATVTLQSFCGGDDATSVVANTLLPAVLPPTVLVVLPATTAGLPPCSQYLRISCTDFGIGISMEDQAKLFSTFVQIRPGQHQSAGGSGLGLAICRRIVELHGGRVGVRSVAGSYSCFFMDIPMNLVSLQRTSIHTHMQLANAGPASQEYEPGAGAGLVSFPPMVPSADLPMAAARPLLAISVPQLVAGDMHNNYEAPDDETTPLAIHAQGTENGASGVATLLRSVAAATTPAQYGTTPTVGARRLRSAMVVDDIASNRLLLARLLRRRGVETVSSVDGGHAALATWRGMDAPAKAALQCVFCDKEMPGDLDGHDTVRAFLSEGYSGAIVGVTGNALEGDRAAFVAAGAGVVLRKPVTGDGLERVLLVVGLKLAGGTLPKLS